ncbi:hypothetical protein IQ07DRAFT_341574 [Pyrenochaeta sp. DS3sAY3a]|nr:hypothetical protein IQ07DRAFT_341574 [Pyrenochaeta sp. DS3sAY3a]
MGKVSGPGDIAKQRFKSRIYTRHIQQAKRSNPQAFCRLLPQTHSDPCLSHPSVHPALLIQPSSLILSSFTAVCVFALLASPLFYPEHHGLTKKGRKHASNITRLHSSHPDLSLLFVPIQSFTAHYGLLTSCCSP